MACALHEPFSKHEAGLQAGIRECPDAGDTAPQGCCQQNGAGNVFHAAATARLPLGDAFALNGRLGVARGRLSGGDSNNDWMPVNQRISGSSTGLMAGFGAEYRVTRNLSVTADHDYFGKLSKQAKGGMLSVGLRANF